MTAEAAQELGSVVLSTKLSSALNVEMVVSQCCAKEPAVNFQAGSKLSVTPKKKSQIWAFP
jgi:hypothetical protein